MTRYRSHSRRPFVPTGFLLIALALAASSAQSRNAYVLISGGISPTENNYSQYVQARAYAKYLYENYPEDSVWVFYGAGNADGKPPVLADVIRAGSDKESKARSPGKSGDGRDAGKADDSVNDDDAYKRKIFISGVLPHNRPATREVIAQAFHDEILPAVRDGGTLYLFVGDHGSPGNSNPYVMGDVPESLISLWSWEPDPLNRFGWRAGGMGADLSVSQLRRWLTDGLGSGKVVFVMSQCFSGGFHYLGVPSKIAPNPSWFTRLPPWASASRDEKNLPRVAGFTSTDESHIASGCTPDVQADNWKGYERYLPQNLVGFDLFTLHSAGVKRRSMYEAHLEAVNVDQTIDLPRSTSEQYLAVWARTIARMAKDESVVRESIQPHLAAFRQTMNGVQPKVGNTAFNERAASFRRALEKMTASNPKVKDLLRAKEAELLEIMKKSAEDQPAQAQGANEQSSAPPENGSVTNWQARAHLMETVILPAWRQAVEKGSVDLPAPVLAFERDLLSREQSDDPSEPSREGSEGIDPSWLVYWHSGYGDPQTFSEARAQQINDWARTRERKIAEWGKTATDNKVRSIAEAYLTISTLPKDSTDTGPGKHPEHDEPSSEEEHPERVTAALRVYFSRQVLAAWQFLLAANETRALDEVASLTALERMPL